LVVVAYRWAEGDYGRLPALLRELVARNVAVIAATCATWRPVNFDARAHHRQGCLAPGRDPRQGQGFKVPG
jgi:hypothetical protein